MFDRKVHVVPLGYEYERVLKPVEDGRANVVALLNNDTIEDRRLGFQDEIEEELLEDPNVELDKRCCDIFDMYDSMETIMETISEYRDDEVYVNLATGTKVTAVSGMIACMATDAEPFYVQSRMTTANLPAKDDLPGYKEVVPMPNYPIEKPTDDQIRVMEYIHESETGLRGSGDTRKKSIIQFAKEEGLDLAEGSADVTEKALYPRLDNRILDPLSEKGFVETERRGNTVRVSLTDEGEKAVRAFRHIV